MLLVLSVKDASAKADQWRFAVCYEAADIRTLATKCCHVVTGRKDGVSVLLVQESGRKFGKRLA
jgi:hypothetical protein